MEQKYSLVMTSCPDGEVAKALAGLLVEGRLAACVQIFPIQSVYTWQGVVHDEPEIMLLIKTRTMLFERLVEAITANHPYEVPEIVQLPLTGGLSTYLNWIDENTD